MYFYFIFRHKLRKPIAKETKIQPTRASKCSPSGNQEMMPQSIWKVSTRLSFVIQVGQIYYFKYRTNTLLCFMCAMKIQILVGHVTGRRVSVVVLTNYMVDLMILTPHWRQLINVDFWFLRGNFTLEEVFGGCCFVALPREKINMLIANIKAGANQPAHWFLGGKGLGIQQGMSVWVGLPKSNIEPWTITFRPNLHIS